MEFNSTLLCLGKTATPYETHASEAKVETTARRNILINVDGETSHADTSEWTKVCAIFFFLL